MKKEDLFCTKDQATKLKSLGVAQQSAYMWGELAAFSSPELGEMLPQSINGHYLEQGRFVKNGKQRHRASYGVHKGKTYEVYQSAIAFAETEAQARASLLISLLENKVIGVDEINLRLLAA